MKRFLVGGAVRDRLLGRPVTERDWLVTGVTPEQLFALGYRQVGRDFPVFLHPQTGEEHALPRAGTKSGDGIEADLMARDLTINALAQAEDGTLIDPLGGQRDIERRILRHTPAFADDPIRALRLARFAARYADLGFAPAGETLQLVHSMVEGGAFRQLTPERVWGEIFKALGEKQPRVFFETLRSANLLRELLPEIDRLFGVPQPETHHPEIDSGIHTMMVLDQACLVSDSAAVPAPPPAHDLGKGATPREILPRHIGHEKRGTRIIIALCRRLKVPNNFRDLAVLTAQFHTHVHKAFELKPATLLRTLHSLDAFRRPERFSGFLLACRADNRGRKGKEQNPYPQEPYFRAVAAAAARIDSGEIAAAMDDRSKIPLAIARARLRAIAEVKQTWSEKC